MALGAYDLCILTPRDVTIDVVGSSVEGGRTLTGITQAIEYSGGGRVIATYADIPIIERAQHRYWNQLAAVLNGSVEWLNVPLWTDVSLPAGVDATNGDAAGSTTGGITALNAGIIKFNWTLPGSIDEPSGGEWFSISHATKGFRAYRIKEALGSNEYRIAPPIREEVPTGTDLDFWRPRCRMRLPAGETMPWQFMVPGVTMTGVINFVEAF